MAITSLITNQKFTHVVHLADVHIRLTKRHDEYRDVFTRLYQKIQATPKETAIFVLGDVMNSKIDLSPECIDLAAEFLFELSSLRPTVLVAGNHDTNLTNRNRLDSLSPIVDALNHPNLFYLKTSGLYGLGNICINNYSVFDSPDKYMKGADIPAIYRNQYEYFLATYHGQVDGAMTDLGFRLTNPSVTLVTFDKHDIALLGDIHAAQDLQTYDGCDKPAIRYCGSLIQQKHDEPLMGHGYSLWSLKDRCYTHEEVSNDFGFYTIPLQDGLIKSDLKNLPKKAVIRFQLTNTTLSEQKAALAKVKQLTEIVGSSYQKMDSGATLIRVPTKADNVVLGNIGDKVYQATLIKSYLENRLKVTEQDVIDAIIKINDEVNDNIKKDDFARNIRWKPVRFEWENMFSYGTGNVIDFTKMKDLVGVFASNASGKSSIFSALTFCMFDKCERTSKAGNIMNNQKTNFRCKFEFELDGIHYFIERVGKADTKGKVKVDVKFWKVENGKDIDLHGEQRRDTNEVIRDYLGTYDDFILTSLSVQTGKNTASIIDMGDTDRKDLFAQFMGLTIFDRLYNEANDRLRERLVRLRSFKDTNYAERMTQLNNFLFTAEELYKNESAKLVELAEKKEKIQQQIVDETAKIFKLEEKIRPLSQIEKDIKDYEQKISLITAELEKDVVVVADLNKQLVDVETIIKELEDKKVTETYYKQQKLITEKTSLMGKLDKLRTLVGHEMEIIQKAKSHEYDPNCSFCVKNAGKIAEEVAEARRQLENNKTVGLQLKAELDAVNAELEKIGWVTEGIAIHTTSVSKRSNIQSLQLRHSNKISIAQTTLADYRQKVENAKRELDLYYKNEEAIKTNLKISQQIDVYKKELANVDFLYKDKNNTLMNINGKILVAKNEIAEISKKLKEIQELEKEYKLYEMYCQAVSRDGIPFDVITATVPEVENEVNNILGQFGDFKASFETDGKNIIPYIDYGGKKWLMGLTSGFERFALSLAIRVALINISNLPRPNFLIVDEGFGVMDAENLSHMGTLFSYLKTSFEFIIVISHLEAMRDIVDQHIEITKDDGFSKVNFV